jgi:hypothetical protein
VITLRCTKKLVTRLTKMLGAEACEPSNKLGVWYATALNAKHQTHPSKLKAATRV